jgi:hypothetical protein
MPSAKLKNISLDIIVHPKVHNLSVSLSIPFTCSPESISLLFGNNPCESDDGRCNTLHVLSEESAIAFALFKLIQEKLCGSPLEVARSKVDHVVCAAHDNSFVVSWNTQGTGSALRKTLGVVLKCLAPNTLFARYSNNMKVLGGKANRTEFNYVANKMIEGLAKQIHFVVVGKIKADTDFKALLETAAKKYSSSSKSPAGESKAPEKHTEYKMDWPKLTCSDGASAVILADYISHQGFGLCLHGRHITIYSHSWNSKRDALKKKDRISGYVDAKYKKLGDTACLFLAYRANSVAMGAGSVILGVAKKIKPAEVIAKNI